MFILLGACLGGQASVVSCGQTLSRAGRYHFQYIHQFCEGLAQFIDLKIFNI